MGMITLLVKLPENSTGDQLSTCTKIWTHLSLIHIPIQCALSVLLFSSASEKYLNNIKVFYKKINTKALPSCKWLSFPWFCSFQHQISHIHEKSLMLVPVREFLLHIERKKNYIYHCKDQTSNASAKPV